MTLKEEEIQDDPIRGTPEIGRRGSYSIACLPPCGSGVRHGVDRS
jgi:hypothetical protein